MATLFGILAAVVLTLSAWMGYRNYLEYEAQIEARQGEEKKILENQTDLVEEKNKLKIQVAEKEEKVEERQEKIEELEQIQSKVATLEEELESKGDLIDANEVKLATQRKSLEGLPDPDVLIPQITKTKKDIESLTTEIDVLKAKVANLEEEKQRTAAMIVDRKEVNERRVGGKSLSSLNTTIRSVYRNWGFVTLNGGDNQGVTPNSTLDVIRNGEVVAKLKVTAVEPNKAAADIVIDDDMGLVTLRAGDTVVAELDEDKMVAPEGAAE